MRLSPVAAGFLVFLVSGPLRAQDKKTDPEKKTDTQITEIGGKSIGEWIKEIGAKDPSKRENAIRTVLYFGPDRAYQAVPAILAELRKHTASTPIDASIRVNGAIALGVILGGVKEAETKYIKEAVSLMRRLMVDGQSIVRYRAAQALGRIGRDAKDAVPELLTASKDTVTWETRQAAVTALGFLGGDEKMGPTVPVLNALFTALKDSALQVRLSAIQSLTWLGAPSNPDLKVDLIKALEVVALKDPEPVVQIWAHMAVMSTSHVIHRERLEIIAKLLRHSDLPVRTQAAQALGTVGKEAKTTIPYLVEALTDPDPMVIGWTIWALGRMEDAAAAALPALDRMKADMSKPEPIRRAAAEAIDQINGKKKTAPE